VDDSPTIKKLDEVQQTLLKNLSIVQEKAAQAAAAAAAASTSQGGNGGGGGTSTTSPTPGAVDPMVEAIRQENEQLRQAFLQFTKQAAAGGGGPTNDGGGNGSGGSYSNTNVGGDAPHGHRSQSDVAGGRDWAAGGGGGGGGKDPTSRSKNNTNSSSGGSNSTTAPILAQLHDAEKRYASLMSKCVMMEEESSNYKRHIEGVVGRYQKELRRYRQGGGGGGGGDRIARPEV